MKFLAGLAALLGLLVASPAAAQATRTWVSGVGDDANPCSRTAPCKTFAGALSKTAAGGEINVLDPGGFGGVTINKSITIDGAGTQASILAVNTNGINVNGAGIVVNLRNLSINGAGSTTGNGIRITQAAEVNIDNVTIMNFGGTTTNGRGVAIETGTNNVRVTIQNSQFINNNFFSIHSNPTGGSVILDVDNVGIAGGGATAIQMRSATTAIINDAILTNHLNGAAVTLELSTVTANITNSVLANNAFGVFNGNDGGAPTARLYASVITGNTSQGLQINGGQVVSLSNNLILGNGGNQTPSSTIPAQ
jgi:hypothetical protein